MTGERDLSLNVRHIPITHTVVGYVASIKVLDETGVSYYAVRSDGLDNMEMLGMSVSMSDDYRRQMASATRPVEDE